MEKYFRWTAPVGSFLIAESGDGYDFWAWTEGKQKLYKVCCRAVVHEPSHTLIVEEFGAYRIEKVRTLGDIQAVIEKLPVWSRSEYIYFFNSGSLNPVYECKDYSPLPEKRCLEIIRSIDLDTLRPLCGPIRGKKELEAFRKTIERVLEERKKCSSSLPQSLLESLTNTRTAWNTERKFLASPDGAWDGSVVASTVMDAQREEGQETSAHNGTLDIKSK